RSRLLSSPMTPRTPRSTLFPYTTLFRSNDVAIRLMKLGGRRITKDGVLVIIAQSHRTQERNRADAQARLVALIQEAAVKPTPRGDRKSTRLNSSHSQISYAVFCLKKKKT